ncbi:hypothetical protein ACFSHT_17560 [Paraburkholderia silviterrae]|uniref:Transmembrane protein n=1 Tax=Paraburkholderia silviterrae TaxID=2528715 RepID=A0A4R5M4P6_9BURK|nr:hypothetical protein [Paraburkholderia silviterrae]TDG20362.1 hypothetical protein EYW47_26295 [Paraburkholderia silviterrae]
MSDRRDMFRIAAARGALDAGMWGVVAAFIAAIAGWWIATGWVQAPLAGSLLAFVSTASGLGALWYAVRIAIDRRLFAAMADYALAPESGIDETLAGLDEALTYLGWISAAKAGRPLNARVRGTIGLQRASLIVAAVQWGVVGVALVARTLC